MEFKFNEEGLIPAIVQDYKTGEVLMLAYMNEEALQKRKKRSHHGFIAEAGKNFGKRVLHLETLKPSKT